MAYRKDPNPPTFREARVCSCGEHGFIGLTRGFVAFVSPYDVPLVADRLWSAIRCRASGPYAVSNIPGGTLYLHREVLGLVSGDPSVDHRSGDTLDNRRENIRIATAAQNATNRRKSPSAKSPYKGVWKVGPSFAAAIKVGGAPRHYLGVFPTAEAAARAYDAAARRLQGEWARTNADLGLLPQVAAE